MSLLETVDARFLGERLRAARSAAGLTQERAAEELGFARTTLVAIERGQRRVSPAELQQLCRLYKCSINNLLRKTAVQVDLPARFRIPRNGERPETASAVSLLNRLAASSLELEEMLDSHIDRRYPRRVAISSGDVNQQAEEAALEFRYEFGLGLAPIEDLVSFLEIEVGIRVFVRPINSKIAGLYAFDESVGACIFLNAKHPRERRAMTAAHETGHFICARETADIYEEDEPANSKEERFANAFALALLIPAASIRRRFSDICSETKRVSPRHLILLAHSFHVSVEAMCRRLEGLALLPRGVYESLRERGLSRDVVRQVLGDPSPDSTLVLPPRLSMLAAEAYRRGLLSEGQLCEKLQMDRVEVRKLLDALDAEDLGEAASVST